MRLSHLQKQILIAAAHDLAAWRTTEAIPTADVSKICGRTGLEARRHNANVAAAQDGLVPIDAATWLGRPLNASDAASFSRCLRTLESRGLVNRVAGGQQRGQHLHTAALQLTPAGEALAAELLAKQEIKPSPATTEAASVATSPIEAGDVAASIPKRKPGLCPIGHKFRTYVSVYQQGNT